mmetsp:Transcript_55953/g.99610  ORF Transcript_55953/g.99610 Transcript_55953/m.99610 type:complete len:104 (-) Transcript_55953:250-561(-)
MHRSLPVSVGLNIWHGATNNLAGVNTGHRAITSMAHGSFPLLVSKAYHAHTCDFSFLPFRVHSKIHKNHQSPKFIPECNLPQTFFVSSYHHPTDGVVYDLRFT